MPTRFSRLVRPASLSLLVVWCCSCTDGSRRDAAKSPSATTALVPTVLAGARSSARRVDLLPGPDIVLGGLQRDPSDEFNHRNGLLSGVGLSAGGFAVADGAKLRLFDGRGRQRAVVGKQGRGPGEVDLFASLCRTRGDTVVAFDTGLRRISVVSPSGQLVRQIPVALIGRLPATGCFDNGTFLLYTLTRRSAGGPVVSVAQMRLADSTPVRRSQLGVAIASDRADVLASGQEIIVADPQSGVIHFLDEQGTLLRALRLRERAESMSPSDASRLTGAPMRGSPPAGRRQLPGDGPPATWPFFAKVLVDNGTGTIWLQDAVRGDFRAPTSWVGIRRDGVVLSRLIVAASAEAYMGMPPTVVQFARSGVWLLRRDADGAASFAFFRFSRPAETAPRE